MLIEFASKPWRRFLIINLIFKIEGYWDNLILLQWTSVPFKEFVCLSYQNFKWCLLFCLIIFLIYGESVVVIPLIPHVDNLCLLIFLVTLARGCSVLLILSEKHLWFHSLPLLMFGFILHWVLLWNLLIFFPYLIWVSFAVFPPDW